MYAHLLLIFCFIIEKIDSINEISIKINFILFCFILKNLKINIFLINLIYIELENYINIVKFDNQILLIKSLLKNYFLLKMMIFYFFLHILIDIN
jgi:hypothetical protein